MSAVACFGLTLQIMTYKTPSLSQTPPLFTLNLHNAPLPQSSNKHRTVEQIPRPLDNPPKVTHGLVAELRQPLLLICQCSSH